MDASSYNRFNADENIFSLFFLLSINLHKSTVKFAGSEMFLYICKANLYNKCYSHYEKKLCVFTTRNRSSRRLRKQGRKETTAVRNPEGSLCRRFPCGSCRVTGFHHKQRYCLPEPNLRAIQCRFTGRCAKA